MTDADIPTLTLPPAVGLFTRGIGSPLPQHPAGVDIYLRSMQASEKADADMWATTMRSAIATDPGVAGEADKLSRKLGMPLGDAQQDIGFLRAVSTLNRMREERIRDTNPILYKSFQGLEFARKAWNDYEHLSAFERMEQAATRGYLTSQRGRAASRLAFGDETARAEFEDTEKRLAALGPTVGFFQNAAEIAGYWGANVPRAVQAGLVTGGAAAAANLAISAVAPPAAVGTPFSFAGGFKVGFVSQLAIDTVRAEGGNAYADMIAAGYDPGRARVAAGIVGLANAVLEIGGLSIATAPIRREVSRQLTKYAGRELAAGASSGFLRAFGQNYATAIGSETLTELTQEVVTILGESGARQGGEVPESPDKAIAYDSDAIASRLWEVASKTMQGMLVLGAPGAVVGGMRAKAQADMQKAAQEHVKALSQSAQASNLNTSDPTAAGTHFEDVLRQGGNEAHVDANALRELLAKIDAEGAKSGVLRKSTEDSLEGIIPGFKDDLQAAAESGGDVTFKLSDLMSTIRGELPEFANALEDSGLVRRDPELEAQPAGPEVQEQAAKADTGDDATAKFYAELKDVESTAAEALKQAAGPKMSASMLRHTAKAYSAMVETVAREENLTPKEAQDRYGIKEWLSAEEIPGDALRQPQPAPTGAEEFVTAYHGTPYGKFSERERRYNEAVAKAREDLAPLEAESDRLSKEVRAFRKQRENEANLDKSRTRPAGSDEVAAIEMKRQVDRNIDEIHARFRLHISRKVSMPERFEIERAGTATDSGWAGTAIYFAIDKKEAESYASVAAPSRLYKGEQPDPYVYEVRIPKSAIYDPATASPDVVKKVETRSEELRKAGLDYKSADVKAITEAGFRARAFQDSIGGGKEIAVFDNDTAKIVDPNILRQPGRGGFDLQRMVAMFTSGADVSTVMHELTHWFVEVVERLDAAGSTYGKAQMDRLLTRWGVTREQWAGMDLAARRPLLEDISYNAEDYFASGEAPSAELRPLFDSLRSFIVNVYRNVRAMLVHGYRTETKGLELKPITPELRDFFDRMLASEQAIEIERSTREGAARLSDEAAKSLGIEGEDLAEIRRLEKDQFDEAKARLTSESLRGARFFQAGRRKAEASLKRKLREAQQRIRGEVEAQVAESPVYQVIDFLRNGKVEVAKAGEVDSESAATEEVSARLDTDAVRAILGDDFDKLPANLTRKGGIVPDHMAKSYGFTSGEAMLRAIIEAPPVEQAVDQRVNERLASEEPLANPKEFKRAVEEALHGKTAARLNATILRAMMKGIGQSVTGLEAQAREAARITLLRTPVGRITVRAMAAAELRAAKARDKAIKSGDLQAAIDAHRKLMVQHYMTIEAAKVERRVERALQAINGRFGKKDEDIVSGRRNLDTVNAGRAILGAFGLVPESLQKRAESKLAELARIDNEAWAVLGTRVLLSTQGAKDWREVSLERFDALVNEADGMWSEAHRAEQMRIAGKLVDRREVQAELEGQLVDLFGGGTQRGLTLGTKDVPPSTFDSVLANMTRLEAWATKIDGGKLDGPWHRLVYQVLKDAQGAFDAELVVHHAWVVEHLKKFEGLAGPAIDLQRFLGEGRRAVFENKAALLGAILQSGTESGFRAMIVGNKFGEQVNGVLVTRWDEAIKDAAERGILTKRDFDLVRDVLNYIRDNLKDRLFATAREVWGIIPDAVAPMPMVTPFGTYPGGYFPSKVDKGPGGSRIGEQKSADALKDAREDFRQANVNVSRSITITRQEDAVQPRIMDIGVLADHFGDALAIIHLQPAITDIARLFGGRQNSMAATLAQVQPYAERNIIMPAVKRMARRSIVEPSDRVVAAIAKWIKHSASMYFLGLNPRNAAQQFTGLANAVPIVGFRNLWDTILDNWSSPRKLVAEIEGISKAMEQRWSREMQLLSQDMERMLNPSKLRQGTEKATAAAFFLQRYTQMATDAIVWKSAYNKATATGKEQDAAVREADQTVRLTQGEKTALDVPQMLAGNALAQLFTQFADYPNTVLNQNIAAPVGQRFATFVWTVMAPTFASSLIAIGFAFGNVGKGSPDDEDYVKRLAKHIFGDQVRGILGMVPVGGGLAASWINHLYGLVNDPSGLRNQPFAGWSIVEAAGRTLSGESSLADALATVFVSLGLPGRPVVNLVRFQQKVDSGREPNADVDDYIRVFFGGK